MGILPMIPSPESPLRPRRRLIHQTPDVAQPAPSATAERHFCQSRCGSCLSGRVSPSPFGGAMLASRSRASMPAAACGMGILPMTDFPASRTGTPYHRTLHSPAASPVCPCECHASTRLSASDQVPPAGWLGLPDVIQSPTQPDPQPAPSNPPCHVTAPDLHPESHL